MLVRKPKGGDRYRIAMESRALTASSGLAPWSMAVDRTSAAFEKNPTVPGGQGGLPLGLPPPLGERGGHPRNFHARKKRKGISTEIFF